MTDSQAKARPEHVLLITLDSCRFDTFRRARTPHLSQVGPLHKAQAPSYFTYGTHSAIGWDSWANPLPAPSNPKAEIVRMAPV